MARVIRFSKHFVARWAERKGSLPCIDDVNAILAGSLRIIKQRSLWESVGGVMIRHNEVSHYWCHSAGVILLVDDQTGTAVTVITPDMVDKYGAVSSGR
jgi:hypothetical protein